MDNLANRDHPMRESMVGDNEIYLKKFRPLLSNCLGETKKALKPIDL